MNWAHQVGINYTLTVVATSADAALRKDAQIRQSALRTQVAVQRSEEKTRKEAQQTAATLEAEGRAWERLGARALKAAAEKRKAAEGATDPKESTRLMAEAEAWERVAKEARGAGVEKKAASEAGGAEADQIAGLRGEAATYADLADEAEKAAVAKRRAASESTDPKESARLMAEAEAWERVGKEARGAGAEKKAASEAGGAEVGQIAGLRGEAATYADLADEAQKAAVAKRRAASESTDPNEIAALEAEAKAWNSLGKQARQAGVEKEVASEAGGAEAAQMAELMAEAATYADLADEAKKAAVAKRRAAAQSTDPKEIASLEAEAKAWDDLGKQALQAEQSLRYASSLSTSRNALLNAGALKVEARAWDDVGDEALESAAKTRIANMGMKETSRAAEEIAKKLGGPGGVGSSVFKTNQGFAFFRNTISMIKWPAIISLIGLAAQALSALSAGLIALLQSLLLASNALVAFTGALGPAVGAIMAYPAIITVALQSIGSFVLAMGSMKDAMKEQQTGLSAVAQASMAAQGATLGYQSALKAQRQALIQNGAGSLEYKQATLGVAQAQAQATQSEKALRDARRASNAEARAFAKFLDDEAKPALASLQQTASKGLFPGLTEGLRGLLSGPLFKTIQEGIANQSAALGHVIQESMGQLNTPRIAANFKAIFATNTVVSRDITRGLTQLAKAATELLVAAQPLTRWFGVLIRQFGDWAYGATKAGRESGRLAAYFERTKRALTALGNILANITVALINTFSSGRAWGDSMLESLDRVTLRWREWTESVTGQNRLDRYFERSGKAATAWGHMLRDFWVALMNIFHESTGAGQELADSLAKSAAGLREMTESVEGQKRIRDFFDAAIPPLKALGQLFSAVLHTFIRLGEAPGLAEFINKIQNRLLPSVERMIRETNQAFGPALTETLTQVARLIGDLAGPGGPLVLFTKTIGYFVEAIDKLVNVLPGLRGAIFNIVSALAVFRATSAVLKIGGAALGVGVLGRIFGVGGAAAAGGAATGGAAATASGAAAGLPALALGGLGMAALAGKNVMTGVSAPSTIGLTTGRIGSNAGAMEAFGMGSFGTAAAGAGAAHVLREASRKAGLEAATVTRQGMLAGLREGLGRRMGRLGALGAGVAIGARAVEASPWGKGAALGVAAAGFGVGFLPESVAPRGGVLQRVGTGVAQGATIGAIGGQLLPLPGGPAVGALAGATVGATKALIDYRNAIEAAALATRESVGKVGRDIKALQAQAGDLRLTVRDAQLQQRAAEQQLQAAQKRLYELIAQGAPKDEILVARLDVDIARASFTDAQKLLSDLQKQLRETQTLAEKEVKWGIPKGWRQWVKTFKEDTTTIFGKEGPLNSLVDSFIPFKGDAAGGWLDTAFKGWGPFAKSDKDLGLSTEAFSKMADEAQKVLNNSKDMPVAYRRTAAAIKLVAQEAESMGKELTAKQFWLEVKATLNDAEARRKIDALLSPRSLKVQIDILARQIATGPSDASDRQRYGKLLQRQGQRADAVKFDKLLQRLEGKRLDAEITPDLQDDINVLSKITGAIRKRIGEVKSLAAKNELKGELVRYNAMLKAITDSIADANAEAAAAARDAAKDAADAAFKAAVAKPIFKPGQLKKMTIEQLERWRARLQKQIKEAREDGITGQERINIARWQRGLKLVNERLNKLLERQARLMERLAAATDRYIAGLNQMFRKLGIEGTIASSTEQLMAAIAQEEAANAKIKNILRQLKDPSLTAKRRGELQEALKEAKSERGEARTLQVEARRGRAQQLRDLAMRRLEAQQRISGSYDTPGGAAARAALITAQIKPIQEEIATLEEKRAQMLAKADKTKDEKEAKKLRQNARAIADAIYEKNIGIEERQAEALELIRQNTGKIEQNTGKLGFEFQGQRFTDAVSMGIGV